MRRIGLLGGSFNPAHGGHLHISKLALDLLRLDEVWWLVSPGNPLKSPEDMAPFAERMASAKAAVKDCKLPIIVSGIENEIGSRYSVDTLGELILRFADNRFVWLMGADNLILFHRWKKWRTFFRMVPIAVFPRPSYSSRARKAEAAIHFAEARAPGSRAGSLAEMTPPAWIFLRAGTDAESATRIRKRQKRNR